MSAEQFSQHPLLPLGILLIAGYLGGRAANYLGLPRVTGYIVAGLLLSPSFTAILHRPQVESLQEFVSTLALAVIAFVIGGSLEFAKIRRLGRSILWISLSQAAGAMLLAALATLAAGTYLGALQSEGPAVLLAAVLIMGAIAAATAPATVLAVVHELRSEGELTTTLLGVVALDDALTIILFAIALSIAGTILPLAGSDGVLLRGLWEIGGALAGGAVAGVLLPRLLSQRQRTELNLVALLGTIFVLAGVAIQVGFSPLLANMTMGFVLVNSTSGATSLFRQLENIEEMLYCLFFTLAGAHFDTAVLGPAAALGLAILLGRFAGKLTGTMLVAGAAGASPKVGRYLGITLLPQAGLSIGLILLARPYLPAGIYDIMFNAMLASVIINELIAPPLVKWALQQAGETGAGEER